MPPQPKVRLKGDRIILILGSEQCELGVIDGLSDDASQLAKAIQGRIHEVLAKRRRDPERLAEWERDWNQHAAARTARAERDLRETMQEVLRRKS